MPDSTRPQDEELRPRSDLLTPKQLRAIEIIVTKQPSIRQLARELNVDESTVYRWHRDHSFKRELDRVSEAAWRHILAVHTQRADIVLGKLFQDAVTGQKASERAASAAVMLGFITKAMALAQTREKLDRDAGADTDASGFRYPLLPDQEPPSGDAGSGAGADGDVAPGPAASAGGVDAP